MHDPEAGHSDWLRGSASSSNREPDIARARNTGPRNQGDRYYELHDIHELSRSDIGVSLENVAEDRTPAAGGIMSTVGID